CFTALRKPAEALRYIDQGLKQNPGNGWLREQWVRWQLENGDPLKAIEPREMAVKQNPEALGPRLALGAAWWQVAQVDCQKNKADEGNKAVEKAKAIFGDVMAKWPDDKLSYAYAADIATYQKDFEGG